MRRLFGRGWTRFQDDTIHIDGVGYDNELYK